MLVEDRPELLQQLVPDDDGGRVRKLLVRVLLQKGVLEEHLDVHVEVLEGCR